MFLWAIKECWVEFPVLCRRCCFSLPSHVQIFVILWTAKCQASLSLTISQSLSKFMSTELVMPSNHFIFCHPLLLLPSIFPSIRVFSNNSAVHNRWPKCWSFSFSISPSNRYLGLISFRINWFALLAVQVTLNNLFQHHCLNKRKEKKKYQFIGDLPSSWSNSHIQTWLVERL